MTVKLGMFTMPFHHPDRNYAELLAEDQEAVVLADQLGFSEAYVGEHFSSWSERITSPLIFLATVISRTRQIRLGTGVLNLPQTHPATVAAHAAMFDQLSGGRFIMGIGPGGLVSDLEVHFGPHSFTEHAESTNAYRLDASVSSFLFDYRFIGDVIVIRDGPAVGVLTYFVSGEVNAGQEERLALAQAEKLGEAAGRMAAV